MGIDPPSRMKMGFRVFSLSWAGPGAGSVGVSVILVIAGFDAAASGGGEEVVESGSAPGVRLFDWPVKVDEVGTVVLRDER